ncbi:MAG: hypothetical protein QOE77_2490 [Blastocatellia bacterium]|jgi:hypothetical protein|nr:hypothetical protein [Blastocatellia bacterium]
MARLKRSSIVLETAERRLAGLKSIRPAANIGANLTEELYENVITDLRDFKNLYNEKSSELDTMQNQFGGKEDVVDDFSKRVLSGVAAQYGTDSSEYEAVGGTRTSERKKPTRKGLTSTGGGPTPVPHA